MAVTLIPEALTTVANVQERLNIPAAQDSDKLINIINRVTKWTEKSTDRKLMVRNYDGSTVHAGITTAAEEPLYFDWREFVRTKNGGGIRLHLPQYPIQTGGDNDIAFSVEPIESRVAAGETWGTALTLWEDYFIEDSGEHGVLVFETFPQVGAIAGAQSGQRIYRIKGTLGFNSVPEDLEAMVIERCVEMYNDSGNISSERIGDWARTYYLEKRNDLVEDVLGAYTSYGSVSI